MTMSPRVLRAAKTVSRMGRMTTRVMPMQMICLMICAMMARGLRWLSILFVLL